MTSKAHILHVLRHHKDNISLMGVSRIGLFGSYRNNRATQQSDIDLLVEFDADKETFDNLMALYDFLETVFEGEKVELVTTNGLSPYIGPHIVNEVEYA